MYSSTCLSDIYACIGALSIKSLLIFMSWGNVLINFMSTTQAAIRLMRSWRTVSLLSISRRVKVKRNCILWIIFTKTGDRIKKVLSFFSGEETIPSVGFTPHPCIHFSSSLYPSPPHAPLSLCCLLLTPVLTSSKPVWMKHLTAMGDLAALDGHEHFCNSMFSCP